MAGGRPLKFESVEILQEKIDTYFASCHTDPDNPNIFTTPYTITGLALALKTSRKVLCEYAERDEFSNAIKEAKLKCENYAEQMLFAGKATGPIFALKNYGWEDKQGLEHTGKDGKPIENKWVVEFVKAEK